MYGGMQSSYIESIPHPASAMGSYPSGGHAGYHTPHQQYPSTSYYGGTTGMPSAHHPPPPPPPPHRSMIQSGGTHGPGTPGPVGGEMGSTTPSQPMDGYHQVSVCMCVCVRTCVCACVIRGCKESVRKEILLVLKEAVLLIFLSQNSSTETAQGKSPLGSGGQLYTCMKGTRRILPSEKTAESVEQNCVTKKSCVSHVSSVSIVSPL